MSTDAQEINLANVPEFIRRQAEEALEIEKKALEAVAPKPDEPEPETPPVAEAPPPPAEPKEFGAIATEDMTKEQRYKVLEGMQRAEARRARELKEKIAELEAKLTAPPPAAPTVPTISPEAEEQLTEALGKTNLQYLDQYLASRGYVKADALNTIKDEASRASQTAEQTARASFHAEMDRLTQGKWQEINKQQWFIDAMNEEEGNTGMTRLEFAKKHLAEMNAPKLAWYFTALKPVDTPAPTKPKIDKKSLASPPVTPPASRAGDGEDEVPWVKSSELEAFSRDVITGKYANRQEEMKKMEARIHAAARAGRILTNQ